MQAIRIGHGYDVHAFSPGRQLILGGVDVPCDQGLLGHSDADVPLHAAMDAIRKKYGKNAIHKGELTDFSDR